MDFLARARSRSPRRHDRHHTSPFLINEASERIGQLLPDQTAARLSMTSSELMRGLQARRQQICRPVICLKRDTSFLRHEENCYTEGGKIHLDRLKPCQAQREDLRDSEEQKVLFLLDFARSFLKLLFRSANLCSTRRSSTHERIDLDIPRVAKIIADRRRNSLQCGFMIKDPADPSLTAKQYFYDSISNIEAMYLHTPRGTYSHNTRINRFHDIEALNDFLSDALRIMTTAPYDATLLYENIERGMVYQVQDVVLHFSRFG